MYMRTSLGRDVLVMLALVGFCGRREEGFIEFVGLDVALSDGDPVHCPALLVL